MLHLSISQAARARLNAVLIISVSYENNCDTTALFTLIMNRSLSAKYWAHPWEPSSSSYMVGAHLVG